MITVRSLLIVLLSASIYMPKLRAEEAHCGQNLVDGSSIPASSSGIAYSFISPAQDVTPFYQWENDNGYCGETSLIQAGLNNGQWMSQYAARLVCQTGLSQSGVNGWCSAHSKIPNYNAQLLLEDARRGVSGPNLYADAATCLANSLLSAKTYPFWATRLDGSFINTGVRGYQDFMSWVKRELIAGHQVTVGVMLRYGADPQYDHEVTVTKIGTIHGTTNPNYFDDDLLFFDDHGAYTVVGNNLSKGNPAIPYGSGSDNTGCTPYVFAYRFDSLAKSRHDASLGTAQAYSVLIPGTAVDTNTGGDGYKGTVPITAHNYGFSVAGPIDDSPGGPYTLPVRIDFVKRGNNRGDTSSATYTANNPNPQDPRAGWQYENSMIGTDVLGKSCTNNPPQYWMDPIDLQVTVSGLRTGVHYRLFEYDLDVTAINTDPARTSAALPGVPAGNFNSSPFSRSWRFTADPDGKFSVIVTPASHTIVIFRAVPESAP